MFHGGIALCVVVPGVVVLIVSCDQAFRPNHIEAAHSQKYLLTAQHESVGGMGLDIEEFLTWVQPWECSLRRVSHHMAGLVKGLVATPGCEPWKPTD